MLKIKISLLKRWNVFIGILLTLLGFSCAKDDSEDDDLICMYGVPTASFIVEGNVKAASSSNSIPNIQVIMGYDTTYTDESGNYQVGQSDFPTDQSFLVEFKDIDGTNNGEFEDRDTTVVFTDPEFSDGDGSWYEGTTTKNIDIELDDKE